LALGGHQSAKGLPEMMKRALRLYVEHEEKRRFGVGRKARKATARAEPQAVAGAVAAEAATSEVRAESAPPGGAIGSPYIRAEVRREVYVRDGGRCTFVAQDGRRCGSRVWLENDHVTPRACGGASDAGNLRLRCRAHNLLHARQCFGALHVAAKVAARQRGQATQRRAA
jgi:hypothetical protein